MPEFEVLPWKRQPSDGAVARELRRDTRMYRREKGRGGHRFHYITLKSLWSVNETHAVLNHSDDSMWLYFYHHPRTGWDMVSWHLTRREAQAAAEQPLPDLTPRPKDKTYGLHVYAAWPERPQTTIVVPCSSEFTATVIADVLRELGCTVTKAQVNA